MAGTYSSRPGDGPSPEDVVFIQLVLVGSLISSNIEMALTHREFLLNYSSNEPEFVIAIQGHQQHILGLQVKALELSASSGLRPAQSDSDELQRFGSLCKEVIDLLHQDFLDRATRYLQDIDGLLDSAADPATLLVAFEIAEGLGNSTSAEECRAQHRLAKGSIILDTVTLETFSGQLRPLNDWLLALRDVLIFKPNRPVSFGKDLRALDQRGHVFKVATRNGNQHFGINSEGLMAFCLLIEANLQQAEPPIHIKIRTRADVKTNFKPETLADLVSPDNIRDAQELAGGAALSRSIAALAQDLRSLLARPPQSGATALRRFVNTRVAPSH